MLRCAQLGLHTEDLAQLSVGMVFDMIVEKANDQETYPFKATAEDVAFFFGKEE